MQKLIKYKPEEPIANFTPSPTKLVRFVNNDGNIVKEVRMNRKQRRRIGIRGGK